MASNAAAEYGGHLNMPKLYVVCLPSSPLPFPGATSKAPLH
jgi:hypothetical protein